MARCLYAGSIKSPVPHVLFRPLVGGRWSVYEVSWAGVAQAWGYRPIPRGRGYPSGYYNLDTANPRGQACSPGVDVLSGARSSA